MKKHRLFVFSHPSFLLTPVLSLLSFLSFSQVSIEGNAFLKNETDHSGIEVTFTQTVPQNTKYLIYTDSKGYYKGNFDIGVYNITYAKDGYYAYSEKDIELFSNQTLGNVNLVKIEQYMLVPGSFPTIQSAINAAYPQDTILVSQGTYNENINFLGKNIVLTSNYPFTGDSTDISNTIIDGGNGGRVVSIISGSTSAALIGFTISHGNNPYESEGHGDGGGITVKNNATPLLENLIITENTATQGGGIYIHNANPLIRNVLISNNTADYGGGIYSQSGNNLQLLNVRVLNNNNTGIVNYRGRISITNSTIANNKGNRGGGLELYAATQGDIYNSIISNNSASGDGGGIIVFGSPLKVYNSIITGNRGQYGIFVSSSDPSEVSIFNSNCWNNSTGNYSNCGPYIGEMVTLNKNGDPCDLFENISMNPGFVSDKDYTLSLKSPCVDAGKNNYSFTELDIDGNIRIRDGDNTGDAIVDMGPAELAFHIDLGPDISACGYALLEIYGDFQTYDWNNGLSFNDKLTVDTGGKYTLEVQDSFGKIYSDSISVTIYELPQVNLGLDTSVCGHFELSAGAEFGQYNWNNGLYYDNPLFIENNGDYFVHVRDTNNCSNYSDTINITINPRPSEFTISGNTNPYDSGAFIYSVPYNPELGYIWEGPEESTINKPDTSSVSVQWGGAGKKWIRAVTVNSYGCKSDTVILEVYIRAVGISPNTPFSDIKLFPNPVRDVLNIETREAGPCQVTIASLNGEILLNREIQGQILKIDLSPFPKGIYLITIQSHGHVSTKRIVSL